MTTIPKNNVKEIFEKALKATKLANNRENLLEKIANKIAKVIKENGTVNLNFICTYNSRRSQLSQVWAYYAMEHYGIYQGNSFSSGVTVSSFHGSTIKALEACGFRFSLEKFSHQNPKYIINFSGAQKEVLGFSKLIENDINETPFIAITTCDEAERKCSANLDGLEHFHLPYIDPKTSDGQPNEKETYLQTSLLIAGEMGYLFAKVKDLL